jgi:outer membrane beta-barrel protein
VLLLASPIALGSALAAALLSPVAAMAQDDEDVPAEDDVLNDILNEGAEASEETAREEREDVESGDTDDRVGVTSDQTALPREDDEDRSNRIIKTLQRKTFLKIGRYEFAPYIGFVTNDPFINRYLAGASFSYHITEIFAFELAGAFAPDFGTADWKAITHQLVEENKVSPDISKIIYFGNLNFSFSPIYGKIAVSGRKIINFDIFGTFGSGIVNTKDDLEALQAVGEQHAEDTEVQFHPTTNFGGGFRVIFSKSLAARLEGRSMIYVETIDSTTLEMKNNFMLLASASFFFPGMD